MMLAVWLNNKNSNNKPQQQFSVKKMQDIECVFESMAGRGSIFISNLPAAQNVSLLHSKGIKAILSVARSGLLRHSKEDIPQYLYIPAQDHEDYDISLFFDQTFTFIEKARKETNVLVHCMAGISRSVTIVIAYLLKKYKYTLQQVMSMIHRRRRKINPNKGFIEQLKKYAEAEGIKCEINSHFMRSLRDHSATKPKRIIQASKEKLSQRIVAFSLGHKDKKDITPTFGVQHLKQDLIQADSMHLKKIRSFQDDLRYNNSPTNEEGELEKAVKDMSDIVKEKVQTKRPVTSDKYKGRGSSIQDKIRKVRDKILMKEQLRMEELGFKKNAMRQNPIFRKTQAKLEECSFERQNRSRVALEQGHLNQKMNQKSHKRLNSLTFNSEKEIQKHYKPPTLFPSKLSNAYQHMKSQNQEKEMFNETVPIETSALYSHLKLHNRINSRLNHQMLY